MNKRKQNSFIKRYWNGEESLGFSFWAISFLGLTVISIPNIIVMMQGDIFFDTMSGGKAFIYLIYILGVFTATLFAYVGLWRCSGKYILSKTFNLVLLYFIKFFFIIYSFRIIWALYL